MCVGILFLCKKLLKLQKSWYSTVYNVQNLNNYNWRAGFKFIDCWIKWIEGKPYALRTRFNVLRINIYERLGRPNKSLPINSIFFFPLSLTWWDFLLCWGCKTLLLLKYEPVLSSGISNIAKVFHSRFLPTRQLIPSNVGLFTFHLYVTGSAFWLKRSIMVFQFQLRKLLIGGAQPIQWGYLGNITPGII